MEIGRTPRTEVARASQRLQGRSPRRASTCNEGKSLFQYNYEKGKLHLANDFIRLV